MQKLEEARAIQVAASPVSLPVSVIVPARNEAGNLPRCLESLRGVGEIYVVDSQSSDGTAEIARSFGAKVVQFHYAGGWPKKRQWAMDTLPLAYDWVFLVDADEALTPELAEEIRQRDSRSRVLTATTSRCRCFSWAGCCATAAPDFTSSRYSGGARAASSAA